jgi:hypothetical protein
MEEIQLLLPIEDLVEAVAVAVVERLALTTVVAMVVQHLLV